MVMISWALFGALIGVAAAQRKGFSMPGAIIAGLLLGPFAFLMFFVSGIASRDEKQKKCPYCAEFVKADAKVCKHCHKDLSPVAAPRARPARP